MANRVLLIGSEGFVGKILRDALKTTGAQVLSTDRSIPESVADGLACDICVADEVDALFRWAGDVSHIVHLAAISYLPEASAHPERLFEVNVNGTVLSTQAMLRHVPGARFLYIGSSEAYGVPHSIPIDESHPLAPQNPYAISKAAAEQYCSYLHRAVGADIVCVRPFNHTGPGQLPRFALPGFADQIARIIRGEAPPVIEVGNLEARRDFLDVRDVVDAYVRLLEAAPSGAVVNVCSGEAYQIGDALDLLIEMSQRSIEVRVDNARLRAVEVPEIRGSYRKLEEMTGWKPTIPFEVTLRDLLDYFCDEQVSSPTTTSRATSDGSGAVDSRDGC